MVQAAAAPSWWMERSVMVGFSPHTGTWDRAGALTSRKSDAERVVGQEPPDQGLAHPDQELDGLRRLDHADHAWEHAQDPGLASAGHEPRRRRRRVQAPIARALVGGEDRGHALELEDGAVDIGLARQVAGVVDEIAGCRNCPSRPRRGRSP